MKRFSVLLIGMVVLAVAPAIAQVTAIKAGRLVDPESGTIATNQVIPARFRPVHRGGRQRADSAGSGGYIYLSDQTVLPGLVDTHNHLALTYKQFPENNMYYLTYVMESTPLRAIQAASNGIQMPAFGFTVVRDMGNNGKYAARTRRFGAISTGLIPATIINSGMIIGPNGPGSSGRRPKWRIRQYCSTRNTWTPTRVTTLSRPFGTTRCSAHV